MLVALYNTISTALRSLTEVPSSHLLLPMEQTSRIPYGSHSLPRRSKTATMNANTNHQRTSTMTTLTAVSSMTSFSAAPGKTSSLASTSNSVSTVGERIPNEQRPRFIQPALKTPTWPNDQGVFTVICSTTMAAPLHLVLATLLDSRTWPSWNAFCPRVTITHQPNSTAPLPTCLVGNSAVDAIANLSTTLRDGTSFIMEVCMDPNNQPKGKTSPVLQVTHLEQFERKGRVGVRLAWRIRGKIASLLTRSERVQEFIPTEDPNVTEYTCWETYYSILASTMKNLYQKQLEDGYGRTMDGMKQYAEKKWEAESRTLT